MSTKDEHGGQDTKGGGTIEAIIHDATTSYGEDAAKSLAFTKLEHSYSFWQATTLYYPAVLWCIFAVTGVICCGIDGAVVGSVVGLEPFKETFGQEDGDGVWSIAPAWLGAFNYSYLIGSVIGNVICGYLYDLVGPRWILMGCSAGSMGSIFMDFFTTTPAVLFVGELLNGAIIGAYPVIASAYIAEVCPLALRGVSGSLVNLSFVIGQFISSGVLEGANTLPNRWSYRIAFAVEWFWPLVIFVGSFFMPSPPYWLLRKGRPDEAEANLRRLATDAVDLSLNLANVRETLRLEEVMKESQGSAVDCFRGTHRRRLIIACMVYCIQAFVGNIFFINYAVYFFELAGLRDADAFAMNMGLTAMGFLGTCLSWPLMSYWGRRTIEMAGCAALTVLVLLIAFIDLAPRDTAGPAWAQSALMLVCNFVYDVTVGPICFVYLCEVASAKVRGVTIGIANVAVSLISVVFTVGIPYTLDDGGANWRGKLGFLFGGLSFLCTVWCYFCLPETKGRTLEELDIMFEQEIPSRKFASYHILGATEVGEQVVVEEV